MTQINQQLAATQAAIRNGTAGTSQPRAYESQQSVPDTFLDSVAGEINKMTDNNIACRKDLDLNAFAREMCLELRRLNLSRPSQIERIARNARLACLEWLGSVTATAKLAMPRHFDVHAPTYEDAAREIDDMSLIEYSHDCVYALANVRGFRQRKTDDDYRKEYANILHKFELGELPKYKNAALQIEDKNNQDQLEQQEKIYMQWLNDDFRNEALAMIPEPFRGQAIEAFAQWKRNKEAGNGVS